MQATFPGSGWIRGGSFFSASLAFHVLVGAGTALYLSRAEPVIGDVQEYIDLGYEQFDEPPQEEAPKPIRHEVAESVPQEAPAKIESVARELQDETSDIAGTQEAAPAPAPVAAPSGGTIADVPYYKIKPKYPREALLQGVEGYVELKIDVKEDGSVDNIRTVGGPQSQMFEGEARRAVAKWKYKPFVDDAGQVIRRADHVVRVEFKLQDTETM